MISRVVKVIGKMYYSGKETYCNLQLNKNNGNFIDEISKVEVFFQPQEDDVDFREETITEESVEEDLLEEPRNM